MDQDYFNSRYTFDASRKKVWRAIDEYLQKHLKEGGTVLELGAGYCDFINQIGAGKKYALDRHPGVAGYCGPDVEFLHSASGEINCAENSVDTVFASNLLEHLDEKELAVLFTAIDRVLRKNGRLILIQPNIRYCSREYWDDFTHVKAYSHISLADFLSSRGFAVVKVEKKFLPFSFKSVLPRSLLLTRLYLRSPWRPFAKQMLVIAEKK